MRKTLIQISTIALLAATPALAQDAPAPAAQDAASPAPAPADAAAPAQGAMAPAGAMTPEQVGVGMMVGTPSANYVAWAADSDMYEIQSSKLALSKSKTDGVKQFAQEMIDDHMTTTKALMAALPNTDPKVPKPGKKLSEDNAGKIAALKAASPEEFDGLYLSQQMMAHKAAWSLHSGYATDGTDPALKAVASSAVPIIEKHLAHAKSMPGAAAM